MRRAVRGFYITMLVIIIALTVRAVALYGQDADAPEKPGECKLYFVVQDKHSRTYQLTCSDPQPDSIFIYHLRSDSQVVYTARAH